MMVLYFVDEGYVLRVVRVLYLCRVSGRYLLPNHMLLALAEALPRELQGVGACCSPMPPFVKQNLVALHRMLLSVSTPTTNLHQTHRPHAQTHMRIT